MKPKLLFFRLAVTAGALGLLFLCTATSFAEYEMPKYEVVRSEGDFEIRDYPEMTIARTTMSADGMDKSFMRLFRFIGGANVRSQKIAMTTPVIIDSAPGQKTMSFVVPRKVAEDGVPKPSGDKVEVATTEKGRFAVFRYSGRRTPENETAALQKLQVWMEKEQTAGSGSPRFAYYDPPWTLPFMRRNEVMIPITRK